MAMRKMRKAKSVQKKPYAKTEMFHRTPKRPAQEDTPRPMAGGKSPAKTPRNPYAKKLKGVML